MPLSWVLGTSHTSVSVSGYPANLLSGIICIQLSGKFYYPCIPASKHLFWCFRLSKIEDSCQCLEGPISTCTSKQWLECWVPTTVLSGADWSFMDPSIPIMVLIGPSRHRHESPVCDKLEHKKRFLELLFVLRVYSSCTLKGFVKQQQMLGLHKKRHNIDSCAFFPHTGWQWIICQLISLINKRIRTQVSSV